MNHLSHLPGETIYSKQISSSYSVPKAEREKFPLYVKLQSCGELLLIFEGRDIKTLYSSATETRYTLIELFPGHSKDRAIEAAVELAATWNAKAKEQVALRDTLADIARTGAGGAP